MPPSSLPTSVEGSPIFKSDDELAAATPLSSPVSSPPTTGVHSPVTDACVGTAVVDSGIDPSLGAHLTTTAAQVFLPFLLAGVGSTFAGVLLDVVKDWEVYMRVRELFILIPPLLGLNGNLEQTLVARLSTQCQSTVATVVACTLALVKGLALDHNTDLTNVGILFAGALAAVNTASLFLSWVPSALFASGYATAKRCEAT
ncbi:solute carrier family 41 member 1-like [Amblyomma americanum]